MDAADLTGAWRLVSVELIAPGGEVSHPLGASPRGLLLLTQGGVLSAHVFGADRPRFASGDPRRGTDAEIRRTFEASVGYYGRWRIDPAAATLTTRVEGSLFPDWEGGEQVRRCELRDGRLILHPPPVELAGRSHALELAWERLPAKP